MERTVAELSIYLISIGASVTPFLLAADPGRNLLGNKQRSFADKKSNKALP
jgi:hypothetical protein